MQRLFEISESKEPQSQASSQKTEKNKFHYKSNVPMPRKSIDISAFIQNYSSEEENETNFNETNENTMSPKREYLAKALLQDSFSFKDITQADKQKAAGHQNISRTTNRNDKMLIESPGKSTLMLSSNNNLEQKNLSIEDQHE